MRILKGVEAAEAASCGEAGPQLLMQRAGYGVAQFCISQFTFRSVCIVCGKGWNGGVGLSTAAVLEPIAKKIWVLILADHPGELRPEVAGGLSPSILPTWIRDAGDFEKDAVHEALGADLIVDAIVGTGIQPPLRTLAAAAIAAINRASGTVVSVDVPSGIDPDSTTPLPMRDGNKVFAHGVIALIAPKPAHVFGELVAGPIAISEIGTQPAFLENSARVAVLTGRDVRLAFPQRTRGAVEGDFGHVLVIGGSRGRAGAVALAGLAAMRAGAGRVTVACPESIELTVAGFGASLFTRGLSETNTGSIATTACGQLSGLLAGKDAVVLGPGLSENPETADFVRRFVADCHIPLVLDGDAVAAFAGHCHDLRPATGGGRFRAMCCSDMTEAARLIGKTVSVLDADRLESARLIAEEAGVCVVVKGARAVIAGLCGESWVNLTGGPALLKVGMGEILAGIIGAALASRVGAGAVQGQLPSPPFHAQFWRDLRVAAAVHLHGLAADLASDALHEHSLAPDDLVEALCEAFRACDFQVDCGLFYLRS